ncbi:serine hydrolase domain-containing protein [Agromyces protaetiae]|nr:serine hydrolase domain-containing protein [Agromyces protaetiae]
MTQAQATARELLPRVLELGIESGTFSAVSLLIALDGEIVDEQTLGVTRRWDAPGVEAREPGSAVDANTRFDLASLTKLVTAATVLSLLDEHGLGVSLRVGELLPEFADAPLSDLTLADLLTHTAGFPAEWFGREPDEGAARFRAGARPTDPRGVLHRYSCVGYIWAGLAAEALGGASLDALAHRHVLDPLGMTETGYRPGAELLPAIAATEYQSTPPRGLVHGVVHDETSWALGGAVGNAGLFGTARDQLRLTEALRLPPGESALPSSVVRAMTCVHDASAPQAENFRQAIGSRIDDAWTERWRWANGVVGHTGFTGTAVATEPLGRRSLVFLTNRVHPDRATEGIADIRRAVAGAAAEYGTAG